MRGVHLSQYFRGRNAEGLPPITSFLRAGCGFGGSCLPKDVKALIAHGIKAGVPMGLLESTIRVNEGQPDRVIALLQRHWPSLKGVRVTVLGLAFKPDTSDVRESPAFPIIRGLLERGAIVKAHDPVAMSEARKVTQGLDLAYCETVASAVAEADALVVVTPWKEYKDLPNLVRGRSPEPVFIDGRRAFDRKSFAKYEGIGL
jgi:UDPglucose 6-dehydrogenase